MTKTEWGEIVKLICSIYPRSNFMDQEDTFNAWYELLNDLQVAATKQAVKNLAKEKEFPPSVSEIRREYQRMYKIYLDRIKNVKTNYDIAMSAYPSYQNDEETFNVFLEKIKKLPQSAWIPTSEQFKNKTFSYIENCELNDKPLPDYKEYINEQKF